VTSADAAYRASIFYLAFYMAGANGIARHYLLRSSPWLPSHRTERDPTALEFFSDSRLIARSASKSNYPSFDEASTDFRRLFIKIPTQTAHPLAAHRGARGNRWGDDKSQPRFLLAYRAPTIATPREDPRTPLASHPASQPARASSSFNDVFDN
jgi:hypothetical protein